MKGWRPAVRTACRCNRRDSRRTSVASICTSTTTIERGEYCERSIALFRAERYINGEVATLLLLGDAQYGLNDFQAAQASYERAASLAHANTFKEAEARAALKLGNVLVESGDFVSAVAQREGALAYYRTTGNRRSEVNTLLALGKTYRLLERRGEAAATLQEGQRISRDVLGGYAESLFLGELALVARDDGRFEEAKTISRTCSTSSTPSVEACSPPA